MPLKLMYITNNIDVAIIAQKYGVKRIWIDLEVLGKEKRQKGINSVKSHHKLDDIIKIKPFLTTSEMLVRINPWNENSINEINSVIDAGADCIMLPMWKSVDEVQQFIATVNGRCITILLLETKEAEHCLDDILQLPGIDEIHIGLNDLHLSYSLTFMFELLTNGTVERICNKIKAFGIPYGFGGIAQIGAGDIPAEKIILEHYRLGSTCTILSRSFCDYMKIRDISQIDKIFKKNIREIRLYENYAVTVNDSIYKQNQIELISLVDNLVIKRGKIQDEKDNESEKHHLC